MPAALREITGGAAILQINNVDIGHSIGGISFKYTKGTRNRVVDRYGNSPVDVINVGDEASVTAPLAEWSEAVLAEVFQQGEDGTSDPTPFMGLGRRAGTYYDKKPLKIVPIAVPDNTKYVELFACCPTGEIELVHNNEDDRVFNTEFIACIDESQDDGSLIGKVYVGTDRGSESA